MKVIIRHEEEKDFRAVEELTRDAFWNLYRPGCDEHYMTHIMRDHPDFIPELAFVAEMKNAAGESQNRIVGSILYTKSQLINELGQKTDVATFGPLCVHPDCQRVGIGTKLIEHTKQLVIKKGFPAIIIWGDPHNYCKHGFLSAKDYGIASKDGKFPLGLLVLELQKDFFKNHIWKVFESSVCNLDQNKVEEFDKQFPPKKKDHHYSQELFSMMIRAYVE